MWRRRAGGGTYNPPQSKTVARPGEEAYVASSRAKHDARPKSYFDEESDDDDEEVSKKTKETEDFEEVTKNNGFEDEEDPLDAFMAGVNASLKKKTEKKSPRPERLDLAARDAVDEAAFAEREIEDDHAKREKKNEEEEEEEARFVDGRLVVDRETKKRKIAAFKVTHEGREYPAFVPTTTARAWNGDALEAEDWPRCAEAAVRPMRDFGDLPIAWLRRAIERRGLSKPTDVQAVAVPAALCGFDVLATAQTGSGKTLAYGWPMLAYVAAQPRSQQDEGPIGLVVCPTRELSDQVSRSLRKFAPENVDVVAVFGGAGKWEMGRALRRGGDIAVATPGRLLELAAEIPNLLRSRCCVVAVDEADRMWELGFHDQLASIIKAVRPKERQLVVCSATMRHDLEFLARGSMRGRWTCRLAARENQISDRVSQRAVVLGSDDEKTVWLQRYLPSLGGKPLVFVSQKARVDDFVSRFGCLGLHGDKDARERGEILAAFKRRGVRAMLVATDLAARGLDLHVTAVVNLDVPKSIEDYVHRVGRAGRRSEDGVAYTLLAPKDKPFARLLVKKLLMTAGGANNTNRPSMDLLQFADLKYVATDDSSDRGFGAEVAPPPSYPPSFPAAPTAGSDGTAEAIARAREIALRLRKPTTS
ncbi:hypothetical protein CTAYLR_008852 [Chrysophaeum taylorii]|uniref:RNA helicase n=1 Tax=Chrysophaeum taylorii TaxID=2483200 RepID=A0AAD7UQ63_9STRA|nr:hypothetical protein CTAYLR_008852 [Chrysophaeum taylorii]